MRARDYREIARNNLDGNWKSAILAGFLASLLGGELAGFSSGSSSIDAETISQLPEDARRFFIILLSVASVIAIIKFVLSGVIRQGYAVYLLNQYDGKRPSSREVFSQFHDFTRGFLLNFLSGLFVFLWTLLFIIPGIIATYRYAMAPFIMAENPDMRPREALRASSELMYGHKWELFCLNLSFIGWSLLAALTLGIGYLWLIPYVNASYAAFYRSLQPKALPRPATQYIPEV